LNLPATQKPTVSVIIPVYNGGYKFRQCLESLTVATPEPDEIIVVADGESDKSWRTAEEFDLNVIKLPTQGGPARARNVGGRSARGDILFFVDADVTVPPDAILQIKTLFNDKPELTAMIGSYDDEPSETNFLSQYKNLLHHYVHQTGNPDAFTFWGACGAIRREKFIELDGFDESYRNPSIEDIELGYRLKKKGCRILLMKTLKVKHLKHWGIWSLLRADFFYRAVPWADLILKEGGFIDDLNLKMSSRISVVSVYLLLFFLLMAVWRLWTFIPAGFCGALLLVLNRDLYRFFKKKRGFGFTLKAIVWHWLYFFYSGLAYSMRYIKHHFTLKFHK
jgi:glycosyltransferase involved in cell wall biosynthesis